MSVGIWGTSHLLNSEGSDSCRLLALQVPDLLPVFQVDWGTSPAPAAALHASLLSHKQITRGTSWPFEKEARSAVPRATPRSQYW